MTIIGDAPQTIELGSTYLNPGATTTDASGSVRVLTKIDGVLDNEGGAVDTNTMGTYILTYVATDASGNEGTATRTVNVVDTTAPVVTIIGDATQTIELGSTYLQPWSNSYECFWKCSSSN